LRGANAGRPDGLAEDCHDQAATMAREQRAPIWELRIGVSLARLREAQGWPGDASRILLLGCARFTEGLSEMYVRPARAVLDAMPKPCV
jgi:hypothetical protein